MVRDRRHTGDHQVNVSWPFKPKPARWRGFVIDTDDDGQAQRTFALRNGQAFKGQG